MSSPEVGKKPTPDNAALITLEQAGRLLMISAERVRQLIKEGYISRPSPGRTTVVSAVQGYIRFLQEAASRTTKTASDTRVRDARAHEIEMRNAVRLRELVPAEDATAAMDYLVGVVNEALNGLAARATRDLDLRRIIEAELHGAKATIAKALAAAAGVVETGGELPYSDADNDA